MVAKYSNGKMFWQGKRVLVTGGSGFIGTHLCKKLLEMGAHVITTVHFSHASFYSEAWPTCLELQPHVESLVRNFSPFDVVFHLAAQAIVEVGEKSTRYTLDTNINGTINLLDEISLRDGGQTSAIIVASTDKVYGRHENLPYHETHSLRGNQQIYEVSKLCADNIAQAYNSRFKLPISITRFGNVYGPGDYHTSRLIPGTILSYLRDEAPEIRSNGQHYRDYLYIDDVVDGYLALAEWRSSRTIDEYNPIAFNFGTMKPARVLDVVGTISTYFPKGKAFKVNYGAEDEIHEQYLDYALAHAKFGWSPKVSLIDGIQRTVEWYTEEYRNHNEYIRY